MTFYTTMMKDDKQYAYLFHSKQEMAAVNREQLLPRWGYEDIKHYRTNGGRKAVKKYFADNEIEFAETTTMDHNKYPFCDFLLPMMPERYLQKKMYF
jgi:hypothetical protein